MSPISLKTLINATIFENVHIPIALNVLCTIVQFWVLSVGNLTKHLVFLFF